MDDTDSHPTLIFLYIYISPIFEGKQKNIHIKKRARGERIDERNRRSVVRGSIDMFSRPCFISKLYMYHVKDDVAVDTPAKMFTSRIFF